MRKSCQSSMNPSFTTSLSIREPTTKIPQCYLLESSIQSALCAAVHLPTASPLTSLDHRYVFSTAHSGTSKVINHLKVFPQLVMTICVDTFNMKAPDTCQILLFRPVSSSSVFLIIETPFRQKAMADEALGHTICKDISVMMSMLQVTGLLGSEKAEEGKAAKALESTPPEAKDCRKLVRAPRIRPISDIGQVELAKADAKLHGCSPSRMCNLVLDYTTQKSRPSAR